MGRARMGRAWGSPPLPRGPGALPLPGQTPSHSEGRPGPSAAGLGGAWAGRVPKPELPQPRRHRPCPRRHSVTPEPSACSVLGSEVCPCLLKPPFLARVQRGTPTPLWIWASSLVSEVVDGSTLGSRSPSNSCKTRERSAGPRPSGGLLHGASLRGVRSPKPKGARLCPQSCTSVGLWLL